MQGKGQMKKSQREKRLEKTLEKLAALILWKRDDAQLLQIIKEALRKEPPKPLSRAREKELAAVIKKYHPRA